VINHGDVVTRGKQISSLFFSVYFGQKFSGQEQFPTNLSFVNGQLQMLDFKIVSLMFLQKLVSYQIFGVVYCKTCEYHGF